MAMDVCVCVQCIRYLQCDADDLLCDGLFLIEYSRCLLHGCLWYDEWKGLQDQCGDGTGREGRTGGGGIGLCRGTHTHTHTVSLSRTPTHKVITSSPAHHAWPPNIPYHVLPQQCKRGLGTGTVRDRMINYGHVQGMAGRYSPRPEDSVVLSPAGAA